ncbi:MAG: DUF445 family protein [Syntrophomonas sp.]|nr:DUF445 family protein [Syntrophomonas sp.]
MKRMHVIATLMLILALIGSIILWPYRGSFIGGLLFAACEASLVGALADWFAVVALFRHPLGLKFIPHTAIIPNNRERITEGIVKIVEEDWLSLDFIKQKIINYQLIDRLAAILQTEEGCRGLNRIVQSVVTNTLKNINPKDAAGFAHQLIAENIQELKISPLLVERMEVSVKKMYGDDVIQFFLRWAVAATQKEEFQLIIKRTLKKAANDYSQNGNFLRRLGKGLGESLDVFNYDEASEALSKRINSSLIEMKNPSNKFYVRLKAEMENLRIADPDSAAVMLSELLQKIINTDAGVAVTEDVLSAIQMQLISDADEEKPVIRFITNMIIEQVNIIRSDQARKDYLESWLKSELLDFLEHYHGVIGRIVREKLHNLNDLGLVKSLEDKVGDDLQWIRINGTVIGALVGILLYLARYWL